MVEDFVMLNVWVVTRNLDAIGAFTEIFVELMGWDEDSRN
jgi:hypothetical protein